MNRYTAHARTLVATLLAAATTLTLAACKDTKEQGTSNHTTAAGASASSSPSWLLASQPDGAVSVTDAKSSVTEGDHVVMRARIGGRMQPISESGAVFTVVDLAIPHCGQNEGDNCPTPWDYCCETPDTMRKNSATVQLVGSDGATLASASPGTLHELDEVIIVGTVGPRPTEDVLVVRAEGIYRITD